MIIMHIRCSSTQTFRGVIIPYLHIILSDLKDSPEWISGDDSLISNYVPQNESDFIYLQMNVDSKKFQDIAGRAQDSTLYHCMKKV